MNGKPACQMLLPSSVLSRRLEHKIKRTSDKEKRKEGTRRKTTPLNSKKKSFLLAFRAISSV
jgi:DNA recombination-dependent growth factor C